jgi:hypothetical protein
MAAIERMRADFYERVERRINWLTPGAGLLAALIVWGAASWRAGAGVAVGALLIWVHYYWLRRATHSIVRGAAQPDSAPKTDSAKIIVFLFASYALIVIGAYVTVIYFHLPVLSVLGGLLALGAAAMAGSVYSVIFENE